GYERVAFVEMGLWAFIIAILTAKAFGIAVTFDPDNWKQSLYEGARFGGHFFAGFLAGVAYLVIAFRRRGVALPMGLDCLAPSLALAHAIGRIGCFMAGCCWGKACTLPWAV